MPLGTSVLLACLASILLAGCGGPLREDDAGLGVRRITGEAAAAGSGGRVKLPAPGTRLFEITGTIPEGVRFVEETSLHDDQSRAVVTRRFLDARGVAVVTAERRVLVTDDEGFTRLHRLTNFQESLAFTFDPPVPIRPPSEDLSKPVSWEGSVRQFDPETGDLIRSGRGRGTLEVLGRADVSLLDGGTALATGFRAEVVLGLGPVTVRRMVTSWYVPGEGVVAAQELGSARAIAITVSRVDRRLRLAPSGVLAAPP